MSKLSRSLLISVIFLLTGYFAHTQVSSVTFGKNRVQFKKFKWEYYKTDNFNVYFNEQGKELAKFALQTAENELPDIEKEAEYSLQRRINIIIYNNFTDFQQTNIGLEADILNTGGTTKLVNNKMLIWFDGDHEHLKTQIREGIARVIVQNMLFGEDLGDVASNQALLDLPEWFTEGYIAYLGKHWSSELDDDLKSEILSGDYKKFSKFNFRKPLLAGHSFWYFIEEKYKKENVTYFLYLARTYKNINKASIQITKKSIKDLTAEFMEYQEEKYSNDIMRRKGYPKGNMVDGLDIGPNLNYYRFNVNPLKKDNSYVVAQFKNGIVRVILNEDGDNKTVLKFGTQMLQNEIHPNYPIMAWDPKGTRFVVIYAEKGKLKMFIYDVASGKKYFNIDLTEKFDLVQDVKYMNNNRTLLFSAVKNGHSDLFTFDIEKETATAITNDVYDDLDPSFVSFPNKTGILFASNRPTADAVSNDTVLPGRRKYNIFMVTNFGAEAELNQITQLTDLKYGDARFPAQYNVNHFTFVSDENGIANRYAGFFTTRKLEPDTVVIIGQDIFRNPSVFEVDSALRAQHKTDVDSIAILTVSADSAYSFPISNYPSNLAETRSAGDERICSEVTRESDSKNLYKLKVDENALYKRNISAPPSAYGAKRMLESTRTTVKPAIIKEPVKESDGFQNEFGAEKPDSTAIGNQIKSIPVEDESVLKKAKLFRYKPIKFSVDFGSLGLNTTVLFNKYQPYGGGSGPIMLSSNTPLNGLITMSTTDLLEDKRVYGGFKIGTNLKDNEWLISYQNLKRRIDWGTTFYRNVVGTGAIITDGNGNVLGNSPYPAREYTNIYQGNISFPFDVTKSIRLTQALRSDNLVLQTTDDLSAQIEGIKTLYSVTHLEYVYDNSLKKANNIWNGMRYKAFLDWNLQVSKFDSTYKRRPATFNFGFDARYYYPLYKNVIWACRAAGDFSWGSQKFIYYLGGVDGWLMFGNNTKPGSNKERYFTTANQPAADENYAFQSLAVNLRGYIQNASNGNNALVINSEIRMPVWSTLFERTVNNAFLRDLQLTQFIDLGTAWNGSYKKISRPYDVYTAGPVTVKVKAKGVGPFLGGYGFGARSTLLGYFIKYDIGWPMTGLFNSKPVMYVSMGFDF